VIFVAINIFSKGIIMSEAELQARAEYLSEQLVELKRQLAEAELVGNPLEIATYRSQIESVQLELQQVLLELRNITTTTDTTTTPGVVVTPIPINQENTVNYNNSSTSTAYDDDGNLNPGWAVDELGTVYFAGDSPPVSNPKTTTGYQADTGDSGDGGTGSASSAAGGPDGGGASGSLQGLGAATNQARSTATAQDTANFQTKQDWRVRLSLAPSATYLYKAENPGILKPLKDTDGVIFPYLPTVNVTYMASYDPQELTHSNYKAYQYRSSSVEQVQIAGDFTAQDTAEANYMLAVIHFFRSVTKMFYGQDQNPKPGTPPPLVFLYGLGDFQFNAHPLVVTSFNYSLPNDVDYIRASAPTLAAGVSTAGYTTASNSTSPTNTRLNAARLNTGGTAAPPQFQTDSNSQPTYVPTKMQIQITALPMVTRNDISNNFSLKQYATGALLRGTQNKRAGIW
jgi:ribosomal protein L29